MRQPASSLSPRLDRVTVVTTLFQPSTHIPILPNHSNARYGQSNVNAVIANTGSAEK